jgi:hypothetical protein
MLAILNMRENMKHPNPMKILHRLVIQGSGGSIGIKNDAIPPKNSKTNAKKEMKFAIEKQALTLICSNPKDAISPLTFFAGINITLKKQNRRLKKVRMPFLNGVLSE